MLTPWMILILFLIAASHCSAERSWGLSLASGPSEARSLLFAVASTETKKKKTRGVTSVLIFGSKLILLHLLSAWRNYILQIGIIVPFCELPLFCRTSQNAPFVSGKHTGHLTAWPDLHLIRSILTLQIQEADLYALQTCLTLRRGFV